MRQPRGSSLVVLPLAAAMFACTVDFPPLDGVPVTCANNSECPEGTTCSSQLGRCVQVGREDIPPRILDVVIRGIVAGEEVDDMNVAGVGSTMILSFAVDEDLNADPIVSVHVSGAERQGPATSDDGRNFELRYTIEDSIPAGAVSLSIQAVDLALNVGTLELPNRLTIDREPPTVPFVVPITYLPGPTNLLDSVDAATVGTTIVIAFATNEPLFATPTVTLVSDAGGTPILPTTSLEQDTFFDLRFDVPTDRLTAADGDDYHVEIDATDLAGNRVVEPLRIDGVRLDTASPATPTSLRLRRTPWGSDSMIEPRTQLEGMTSTAAVVGANEKLGIFNAPSAAANALLDIAEPSPPVALSLGAADRVEVFVAALDSAGNASGVMRVNDGRWTASFRTGAGLPNPHTLHIGSTTEPSLLDSFARRPTDAERRALAASDDSLSLPLSTRTGGWRLRRGNHPPGVWGGALAYSSRDGSLVMAGGSVDDNTFSLGVWTQRRDEWSFIDLGGQLAPGGIFGSGMAYDARRGNVILHGGYGSSGANIAKTWEWNGTSWLEVTPTSGAPSPAAALQPLVWDSGREEILLFGGVGAADEFGDCPDGNGINPNIGLCVLNGLWAWDGSHWNVVDGSTIDPPPPRLGHGAAFDPLRGRLVIFGGFSVPETGPVVDIDDLWEWDGTVWTERPAVGDWPSPRHSAVTTYLPQAARVVIWGGCFGPDIGQCEATTDPDAVYLWDGASMDTPAVGGVTPGSRGMAGATLGAQNHLIVVGGFRMLESGVDDTVCDPHLGACDGQNPVVRGGGGETRCVCEFDTSWELRGDDDEVRWSQIGGFQNAPLAVDNVTMIYSSIHHLSAFLGGQSAASTACDEPVYSSGFEQQCSGMWSWVENRWRREYTADFDTCGDRLYARPGPCPADSPLIVDFNDSTLGVLSWRMNLGTDPLHTGLWRTTIGSGGWTTPPSVSSADERPPSLGGAAMHTLETDDGSGTTTNALLLFGGVPVPYEDPSSCDELATTYGIAAPGVTAPGGNAETTSCLLDLLWILDSPTANVWRLVSPPGATPWPTPRADMASVSLSRSGPILFIGGCTNADANRSCSEKSAEIWRLDLPAVDEEPVWTLLDFSIAPPARNQHTAVFVPRGVTDDGTGVILLFGGIENEGPGDNEVWALDLFAGNPGSAWRIIDAGTVRPETTRNHGASFDQTRNRMLVYGGAGLPQLWELDVSPFARPAALVDFDWASAGVAIAVGSADAAHASIRAIDITLVGDGTSTLSDGSGVQGLALEAWHGPSSAWRALYVAPGGASTGAAEPGATCSLASGSGVRCVLAEPLARDYVFAGTEALHLRITPAGGIGPGMAGANMMLDLLEVQIDYQLPDE